MRKIKLFIAMSLDGYIADEKGAIDWLEPYNSVDDDTYDFFYKTVDTVVMGRKTYEQVTEELSPDVYPYEDSYTYVVSSQDLKPRDNMTVISEDVVAVLNSIKHQEGKDLWIVGGARLVSALVDASIIDEYWIAVAPVLLGKGIPLFDESINSHQLNLIESYTKGQLVYMKYQKRA
ncbi:dihydrofolate reductase family protein [Erysipelothrix rhusiopathiae]|uniref:dihydrofolate reductase family protein n=1 Tax=Erysipelothrix rhusiopathiae TaxID=1648 RepID=UPI0020B132F4|nr:dihydrofolate reductase family protein [Erysipelothrix rhusiopathiae]MDE8082017.1 dihydrofolate reductase family protein [Erysipelothrix rhusiopathiae]MDE8314762.1 dihydrofolate reductase family protein [Erysipelothrix rhusiopathiae]MDE8329767.1 dihydrofolate reductase family protein [Erysipelothrix rhusiopathiae]